jgi:hypothetical protein
MLIEETEWHCSIDETNNKTWGIRRADGKNTGKKSKNGDDENPRGQRRGPKARSETRKPTLPPLK